MNCAFRATTVAVVCLCMFGCSHSPPAPQDTIPVADVLNALACGLAVGVKQARDEAKAEKDYADAHHTTPRFTDLLSGQTATIKLELKTVDTSSFSAGINASKTGVLKFGWGGIAPSLGASSELSWTVDSTIVLAYQLDGYNAEICDAAHLAAQPRGGDQFGFSVWLGNTLASLSRVSNIGQTSSRSLTYDSNFGVTYGGTAGASLTVAPIAILPVSLSADASRNDVQHLNVVIGKPAPPGGGGDKAIARFSQTLQSLTQGYQPVPPVSLSSAVPAI